MNKENHIYIYNSTMRKKEILLFAITWRKLEHFMLSEISQKEKDKCLGSHLYVKYKTSKIIETESSVVIPRGWWVGEMGRYWLKGRNFQL